MRTSTGQLNRMLRQAIRDNPPPVYKNRRSKIYYATQVATEPPTIVLFCNQPSALDKPYQRYLLGKFRDELKFAEVPIKLYLRRRASSDARDDLEMTDAEPREVS